jgi:hypothetical protein
MRGTTIYKSQKFRDMGIGWNTDIWTERVQIRNRGSIKM